MSNKLFLGFLVGLVASIIAISALVVYFLRPIGSDVVNAPPVRQFSSRQVRLKLAFKVPPQLKPLTQKGGFQLLRITQVNDLQGSLVSYEISRTGFEEQAEVDVNFDVQFVSQVAPFPPGKKVFVWMHALYCYGKLDLNQHHTQICTPVSADVISGLRPIWIPLEVIEKGETFDAGTIPFTTHNLYDSTQECLDKQQFLTGTVVPTSEFLSRIPKGKKAVLSVFGFPEFGIPGATSLPFHVQEIQIIKEGTPFSVPMPAKVDRKVANAYIRFCDARTPTLECLPDTKVINFSPTYPENLQFRLIANGLRRLFCGERDRILYLHWHGPFDAKKEARVMREQNPSLPAEIIEPIN